MSSGTPSVRRSSRRDTRRRVRRWLPGLLVIISACQGAPPPNFGTLDRFYEDPVVGNFIAQRLDQTTQNRNDPELWIQLGMTFEANDFATEAVQSYSHALQLEGGATARTWYRLGNVHYALSAIDDAVRAFRESAEANPEYAPTFWRLGQIHLNLGEHSKAATEFSRALEIDDEQFPAKLGLAKIHLQTDDFASAGQAVELVEPIVQRFPSMRQAHTLLGLAYRKLGRLEEARQHLETGVRGTSTNQRTDDTLGFGHHLEDPWQRELKAVKVSHRMVLDMARQSFMNGDLQGAAKTLEDLRQHRPDDVTLGLNLANVYRQSKRSDDAVAVLQDLVTRHPDRFHVTLDLAWSLLQAGNEDKALIMADRAEHIDPHHPGPSQVRARIQGITSEPR